MTKEEQLIYTIVEQWGNLMHPFSKKEQLLKEYAKQQAIAFSVFRDEYKKEELRSVKAEEKRLGGMITWIQTSDERIYEEFIEQQNKANDTTK